MTHPLSDRAVAAAFAESTDEAWLVLLDIDHEDLEDTVRLVNNPVDIVSEGNTYLGFAFEITLPGEDPERPMEAKLRVDNVSRLLVETIRTISSPFTVTAKVVLASQPDVIERQFAAMVVSDVTYTAESIDMSLRFEDILNEPTTLTMTPGRLPGLF